MSADGWIAPGPGSWELDDLHKATTYTPAFVGVAAPAIGEGFAEIGRRYGMPFERLEVAVVRNRTYGRMVITGAPAPRAGKAEQVPPTAVLKVLARLHPALRRRARAAAAAAAERRWLREAEAWWADERPAQLVASAALQQRIVAAADPADAADLATLVEDAAANLRVGVLRHFRLIGVQLGVARLQLLLAEHGIDAGVALDLLSGASPATSASRAALDEARAELERAGASGPWSSLADVRAASPRAADLVEEHLATWGHRIVGASDVDGLTLVECPGVVLAALGAPPHEPAAPADDAADAVRDRLPDGDRAGFDAALAEARTCYAVREDEVGIDMSWGVGLLRHALLVAGAHLVAGGRLSRAEDAFELGVEETAALLRGAGGPTREEIDARRSQRQADDAVEAPPWLGAPPVAPPPAGAFPPAMASMVAAFGAIRRHIDVAPGPAGPAGSGLGVGTQVYEGRARVAVSPDELLLDLEPGDVLVTSITTPAFNAVLPMLGAIVTERGGLLSHPAIAARELDIPAVIGAAGVLTTIADGATVVVDPVAGTVTVADRTAPERLRPRA